MGESGLAVRSIKVGNVFVDLIEGDRICGHIAKGGTFEPNSLARWAGMCSAGTTALDVGAYSGLFSIAAAKLGCRVWAFEPMPEVRQRLLQNIFANDVSIDVRAVAVSDRDGSGVMHHTAVELTSGASMERKSGLAQDVVTLAIDSLGLRNVGAIKIDVERHEAAVLRGARDTLKRCRPKLLVEALDETLKQAVLDELGGAYRLVEVLDVRNLYLEPV